MKNFLEATVIKPSLKLKGKLTLAPSVKHIRCFSTANGDIVFNDWLKEETTFYFDLPIDSPINISIQAGCTRWDEQVNIIELSFDDFEVIPKYQHLSTPPKSYIDFNNGSWTLEIPDFYPWYHEITGQGWII